MTRNKILPAKIPSNIKTILALFVALFTFFGAERFKQFLPLNTYSERGEKLLKYASFCHWNWNPVGNLRTVDNVFHRLGYESVNATAGNDWDIFWTIEYPFSSAFPVAKRIVSTLKPHQRVNHFPGIGWIAEKKIMCSQNPDVKAVIPGFDFYWQIEQFKEFVKKNPTKRFVEKGEQNRGIKIVPIDQVDYNATKKFYQVFLENPFLVDGHAMDFSLYVLITSIEPLRVYRIDNEVHLRFCNEPYHPFDASNVDKYVVSDSRKTPENMPSLKNYFTVYGATYKSAIENYLQSQGCNLTELWGKIDDAIVHIIRNAEPKILNYVSERKISKLNCVNNMFQTLNDYNTTRHFFEFVRIDFLISDDFEPHVTEINMSPGITPNKNDEYITPTLEQVIFNVARTVGLESYAEFMEEFVEALI